MAERIRIMHVVYRLAMGGMENGMINLINTLPASAYEHRIISLTDATDFAHRIRVPGVRIECLHHAGGNPLKLFRPLWRIFREFRPDICHSRNVGTIEVQLIAMLSGVAGRVHGEHGWDMDDVKAVQWKRKLLRRLMKPFIHCQIAVSRFTERFLVNDIGVSRRKVVQISNGVDTEKFRPDPGAEKPGSGLFRIGAMGRLAAVKNFPLLLRAFQQAASMDQAFAASARLDLYGAGDGATLSDLARELGITDRFQLHGATDQVREALTRFDVLVLPSFMEGLSNTILEAQSCAVPVLASRVGGNVDLIQDQVNGRLFDLEPDAALAELLLWGFRNRPALALLGRQARQHIEEHLSLGRMAASYAAVYQGLMAGERTFSVGGR